MELLLLTHKPDLFSDQNTLEQTREHLSLNGLANKPIKTRFF
jgi:hypothetical protein